MYSRHGSPSDLAGLIERYLDGVLDPVDRAALEARLDVDPRVRAEMTEALATRALLEMTLRDEVRGEAETCLRARDLVPGYRQGLLDARDVGFVARHLDGCRSCAGWYEGYRRARTTKGKAVRAFTATGFVVVTALVLGPLVLSGAEPTPRVVEADPIFRTVVPLDEAHVRSISKAFVTRRRSNQGVETALRWADRLAPDWVDRMLLEPRILEQLDQFNVPQSNRRERRELAFLLGWCLARNVSADDREIGLKNIQRKVGLAAQPLFRQLVLETRDPDEFYHAVTLSVGVRRVPEDKDWLRQMWTLSETRGFTRPLAFILESLTFLRHPDVVKLCSEVLDGRFGTSCGGRYPPAAWILLSESRRREDPALAELVIKYAEHGRFPLGRAMAVKSLYQFTKEQRWKTALHDLLEDPDPAARWVAFEHVTATFETTKGFLERFTLDPDPRISAEARRFLAYKTR